MLQLKSHVLFLLLMWTSRSVFGCSKGKNHFYLVINRNTQIIKSKHFYLILLLRTSKSYHFSSQYELISYVFISKTQDDPETNDTGKHD